MKNIQFPSIQTAYKILAASALLTTFAIVGILVGVILAILFMPMAFGRINGAWWILSAISVGLLLFVWSIFRLVKPLRYDRNWQIAEYAPVPLYWLLLFVTVDLWLGGVVQRSLQALQGAVDGIL